MARKKVNETKIKVGNIRDVSGKVAIAGHDIYEGYTAEQVSVLLTQVTSTLQPKKFDGRSPYKGLDVFEEDDAEFFFGREKLVEDLVRRVKESRTVFITGPSGSGKSSLVRAGLIHALKQGEIKGSDRWHYEILKPGWEPLNDLALTFSRLKGPDLADYFQAHVNDIDILNKCADSVLSGRKDQRLVLFVDQFEEVFTQTSQETERRTFLNMLAYAGTVTNGRVIVLFAIRSDFISNCATYPAINELLGQQFRQIGAMQPDELVSAIALPAIHVGLPIQDELIVRIVNDMKGEPGALPLMQFALKELFEAGDKEGGLVALTLKDYVAREGIQKMLARHADDTLDAFRDDQRELARSIFSRLIEIEQGRQTTRRMAFLDELIPANATREEVLIVVQKLADARLLTTDEQDSHKYTITHEALIDAWPWLKKLTNEYREVIAIQNEIEADAREWKQHQRERSYLYSGSRLANVREQLDTKKLVLTGTAHEFIQTGIKNYDDEVEAIHREQARRRRLQTRIITGLVGFLTVILLLLTFVLNQLKISHALQLGTQAQVAFAEQNFNLAALYASQSNQIHPNNSADEILDQLPYQNFGFGRALLGHTQDVTDLGWSADGRLASIADDGTLIIWNLKTDQPAQKLASDSVGLYSKLAWSGDGHLAAAGYTDGTVKIWDPAKEKLVQTLQANTLIFTNEAWSPDGRLASGTGEGGIIIWDLSTGRPAQTLKEDKGMITSLAWSHDGRLASAGGSSAIIWDLSTGQPARTFDAKETLATNGMDFVDCIAWSVDGKYLASVFTNGSITIWDSVTGQAVQTIKTKFYPTSIAWSVDGRLASGTTDGTVIVWDLSTGQSAQTLYGHTDFVSNIVWSPDGHRLASASNDNTVIVWDLKMEAPAQVFTYTDTITSEAWSADGRLASGSSDGTIIVSDRSGLSRQVLKGHKDGVTGVTWSSDGRLASGSYDGMVIVWNVSTGRPVQTLKSDGDEITCVVWSEDGHLASGSKNGTVIIWDLDTGQPAEILKGYLSEVTTLAWSMDGRLAFAGQIQPDRGAGAILVWDLTTRQLAQTLKDDNVAGVTSVAWSADGRLVSGTSYSQIIIWDLDTGKPAQTLKDAHGVGSLAWSWDGYLASSSGAMVTIWDLADGQPIQTLKGYPKGITSLAWSRDGRLAIGSANGTNIARAHLLRTPLCQWLFRNMTESEWASYQGVLYTYQPACPNLPSPSMGMLYSWKGRATLMGIIILIFVVPISLLRLIAVVRQRLSRRTRKT